MFAQVGIRKLAEAQGTILSTLTGVKGRGKSGLDTEQRSALEQAVEALEVRHGVNLSTALLPLLNRPDWQHNASRNPQVSRQE